MAIIDIGKSGILISDPLYFMNDAEYQKLVQEYDRLEWKIPGELIFGNMIVLGNHGGDGVFDVFKTNEGYFIDINALSNTEDFTQIGVTAVDSGQIAITTATQHRKRILNKCYERHLDELVTFDPNAHGKFDVKYDPPGGNGLKTKGINIRKV